MNHGTSQFRQTAGFARPKPRKPGVPTRHDVWFLYTGEGVCGENHMSSAD